MAVNKSEGTFSQSFPQYKEGGEVVEPILERSGLLSRKSRIKIPGIDGNKLGQPRTLALRRLRRELVDEARSTSVKLNDERAQEIRSLKRAQALISDPDEKDKIREQIRGIFVEKNAPRKKLLLWVMKEIG